MEQTTVEWLINQLGKSGFDFSFHQVEIEKAKEMEEQQQENIYKRERFRAIDFAKWFADFNGLTWEEKRVSKERLDNLYEQYLQTLGGGL